MPFSRLYRRRPKLYWLNYYLVISTTSHFVVLWKILCNSEHRLLAGFVLKIDIKLQIDFDVIIRK